jgi:acetate kinase
LRLFFLKFSLFKPENGEKLLSGLAERLFSEQASIKIKYLGQTSQTFLPSPFDHQEAIKNLVETLLFHELNLQIFAIGHRVGSRW